MNNGKTMRVFSLRAAALLLGLFCLCGCHRPTEENPSEATVPESTPQATYAAYIPQDDPAEQQDPSAAIEVSLSPLLVEQPAGYTMKIVRKCAGTFLMISSEEAMTSCANEGGFRGHWVGVAFELPADAEFTYQVDMDCGHSTVGVAYYVEKSDGFAIYFNASGYDCATVLFTFADGTVCTFEVDFSDVLLDDSYLSGYSLKNSGNYAFWSGKQQPIMSLTNQGLPHLRDTVDHWIYQQDRSQISSELCANWILGVTIEAYQDALLATWGFNCGDKDSDDPYPYMPNKENTLSEETYYAWSYDHGETWTEPAKFVAADLPEDEQWATTHSVSFIGDDGNLYVMLNCFAERSAQAQIRPYRVELHRWNDQKQTWDFVTTCATDFQVQTKPVQLSNGRWFMSGCVTQVGVSGYAVSENAGDFTSFTVTKTPGTFESASYHYYNETSFWYNREAEQIVLTVRCDTPDTLEYAGPEIWGETPAAQANKRMPIMVSVGTVNQDGTIDFSEIESSGFYATASRKTNGYLSDGRPFIIFNQSTRYFESRRRLVIGVGDPGTASINRVYVLDDYEIDQSITGPTGGGKSYPDAVEADGILYVSFSNSLYASVTGNRSDAKLITVPVSSIPYRSSLAKLRLLVTAFDADYKSPAMTNAREVLDNADRTASEIDQAYMRLVKELEQ